MWYYETFPQASSSSSKSCVSCKTLTCPNAPTFNEQLRSSVLNISRQKMFEASTINKNNKGDGIRCEDNADLRRKVCVRNTLKRIEKDIRKEIEESFFNAADIA